MPIWTPGGKDEPLECKQRRDSYLQNLPSVPPDVIEVSRFFLDGVGNWQYEQELHRILSHDLMQTFWHKLRLKFNKNSYNPAGKLALEHNWHGLISRCICLMVYKGGKLPDMSITNFHNARKGTKDSGVAGDIRRLKNTLNKPESAYKNIAELSVFDLVKLCSKSENKNIAEKGENTLRALRKSPALGLLGASSLQEILTSLLEKIDKEEPLSLADSWVPTKNIPQLNRKNAQRLYFSENFLDALFSKTNQNCWSLAATAENAVFNLPKREIVEGHHLRDRAKKKGFLQ